MILFYDPQTGLIRSWLLSGNGDELEGFPSIEVPGLTDARGLYVWQGAVHPLPAKPDPWTTFDPAAGAWVDMRSPEQTAADLAKAKRAAIAEVNAWAAAERVKHITIIPGQDMIYLAKEAEAVRWLAADPAPADLAGFPLIAAEVGITAETPWHLAQIWAQLGQIWRGMAAQIEAVRLGVIKAVEAAGDAVGVETALSGLPKN